MYGNQLEKQRLVYVEVPQICACRKEQSGKSISCQTLQGSLQKVQNLKRKKQRITKKETKKRKETKKQRNLPDSVAAFPVSTEPRNHKGNEWNSNLTKRSKT